MWTLFLQLNTFFTQGYAWLRLVTLCHLLLYFLGIDLYTVSMTLVDATKHKITVSHVKKPLATI